MFKSGFVLTTDAHLSAAMFNQTTVVAYQNGETFDFGGVIEKLDEHTVTIEGMHYMKAACEFKIR
jgi:hypothetical protein